MLLLEPKCDEELGLRFYCKPMCPSTCEHVRNNVTCTPSVECAEACHCEEVSAQTKLHKLLGYIGYIGYHGYLGCLGYLGYLGCFGYYGVNITAQCCIFTASCVAYGYTIVSPMFLGLCAK